MRTHGTVEQVANSSAELRLAAESWGSLARNTYGFSTETFIEESQVTVIVLGALTIGFDLVIEISPSGITAHREYENGKQTPVSVESIDRDLKILRELARKGIRA